MYCKKYSQEEVERVFLVLEYAPRGELSEFVWNCGLFPEPIARYFYKQLIEALGHLYSNGMVHRDIKPENWLISEDYTLKIADFGFSVGLKGRDGTGMLTTPRGTECYKAPEILANEPYSGVAADLFASAIIAFTMITAVSPFRCATGSDIFYKHIINEKWNIFWRLHRHSDVSEEFKDFVQNIFCHDPNDRLKIE